MAGSMSGVDLLAPVVPPTDMGMIVPAGWMPACQMTYLTLHWTAGVYEATGATGSTTTS